MENDICTEVSSDKTEMERGCYKMASVLRGRDLLRNCDGIIV